MRAKSIFVFLLLFSCQSTDQQSLEFLNDGLGKCTNRVEQLNDRYFVYAEMYMYENPSRFHNLKVKVDSLKILQSAVEGTIDSIENQILPKSGKTEQDKMAADVLYEFASPELKSQLESSLKAYSDFINKNSIHPPNSNSILKTSPDKISFSVLNLLRHDLITESYLFLNQKLAAFESVELHPNKYVPVINPKERFVYQGETFEAEIFLAAIDTSLKPIVLVENDTLIVKNGRAKYLITNTNNIGQVVKTGKLMLYGPYSELLLEFPLEINFKIVKK